MAWGMPLATFLDGEPVRGRDGGVIAPEVNGRIENKGKRVGTGDYLEIELDLDRESAMLPQELPLDIVYEDDEIIVINGGDGRTRLEWSADVTEAARAAGVGLDADGYLAPWSLIEHSLPPV